MEYLPVTVDKSHVITIGERLYEDGTRVTNLSSANPHY
jgi:hypothetical protein